MLCSAELQQLRPLLINSLMFSTINLFPTRRMSSLQLMVLLTDRSLADLFTHSPRQAISTQLSMSMLSQMTCRWEGDL
jgi:hypothetical protein